MRKNLFMICFIAVLALSFCSTSDAKAALKDKDWDYGTTITKVESRVKYLAYPSKNGKEAWIYRVSGPLSRITTLSIPKTIDGRKVTRIGDARHSDPDWHDEGPLNLLSFPVEYWDTDDSGYYTSQIKKVLLPDTIEVIEPCTFGKLHSLETIKIPKNVSSISGYTFYECMRLKKVILPEKLKTLDPLAFHKCPNLKKLQLSSKNKKFKIQNGRFLVTRKEQALVFSVAGGNALKIPTDDRNRNEPITAWAGWTGAGGKTLNIPDGIRAINKNACNNVTAPVVHIPASVRKLEADAFACQIKDVTVDEANPVFKKEGQCIYRVKDKSLAVAIFDENLNLRISDTIEKLRPEYSRINYNKDKENPKNVILPPNLKLIEGNGLYAAEASDVYFTCAAPPKVLKTKKWKGAVFPFINSIYVPKGSLKAYKAWYKKYDSTDWGKWYTFEGSIPVTTTQTNQIDFSGSNFQEYE